MRAAWISKTCPTVNDSTNISTLREPSRNATFGAVSPLSFLDFKPECAAAHWEMYSTPTYDGTFPETSAKGSVLDTIIVHCVWSSSLWITRSSRHMVRECGIRSTMGGNSRIGFGMARLTKITAHDQGDVVTAKGEGTAHHANVPLRRKGLSGLSE